MSLRMANGTCLQFSMQEEDILEHTNVECHLCTLQGTRRPLCIVQATLHNTIEHVRAKTLVSTLKCQVSRGDINSGVVDKKCKLR